MRTILTTKTLISLIIILTLGSMLFLVWLEQSQRDPLHNKSWWTLSFVNPLHENSDFTIQNYTVQTLFHYTITDANNSIFIEDDIIVPSGQQQTITLLDKKKPVVITVTTGDEEKTLFK